MSTAEARQTKRGRSRRGWWVALLVVLAAGAGLWFFLARRSGTAQAQSAPRVETATATRGDFRVSVSGPGTLIAHQTVDLKAQVQGVIQALPKVGDRVTKGQLVVRIDPSNYQRQVDNARLSLRKAQAQLESAQASQTNALASQQQAIASAQSAYANAQTQAQSARSSLEAVRGVYQAGGATRQSVGDAERAYQQAQANLGSAQVALRTAREALPLKQSGNAADLRNLQLAVEQSRLTLKNAEADLANTKLYAPFNGTVSAVNAQVGGVGVSANVSGSSALVTIIDDSSVDLPAQVDETEISKVKLGQPVEVSLDAFSGETFRGKVTAVTPSATVVQNIAVFYVTVNVPNEERRLKPGMTAEGEIIAEEIRGAVQIPRRAVETVRNRAYVSVRQPDGTAEQVRVRLGPDDGNTVVVTSGLEPGAVVVLPTRGSNSTQNFGGP